MVHRTGFPTKYFPNFFGMFRFWRLEFFNLRHLIKLSPCNQYYQPVWSFPGTKNDKWCGNAHSVSSTLFWKAYCRAENKDCRGIFFLPL